MHALTRAPNRTASPSRTLGPHRLVAAVLLAIGALTLAASPAFGHTGLDASDPPADATVDEELDRVTLTFTAPITLLEDTVVATSDDGTMIGATETVDDEGIVATAHFDSPLGAGDWTISWRVLAADSHPRTGDVPVSVDAPSSSASTGEQAVGTPDADDSAEQSTGGATDAAEQARTSTPASTQMTAEPGRALERAGDVARILFYIGLLVAAGLTLFTAGPHAGQSARARRLAGVALTAALLGVVAGVAEVAFHVGAVSGRGLAGVVDTMTWRVVLATGLGPALALRIVGLALLAVGARRRVREGLASGPDWRKLLGALLAIGSFQFVGHTASAAPPVVVRSADLAHAIAAAVWIGGLVGLTVTARGVDTRQRAVTVARFSTWATGAVAGVTLAGVALALVNLPTLGASWETGYGRLLLAKLVIVAVLLALGAHNHFNVVPDVTAGDTGAAAALRSVVRWELLLVAVVVVLTALLVNTTPL